VGRIDVDADGETARPGVQIGSHGTERLAQHDVGAAMQQADRLRVALHGHRADASLDGELGELDPHLLRQRAHAALRGPLHARHPSLLVHLSLIRHTSSSASVRRSR